MYKTLFRNIWIVVAICAVDTGVCAQMEGAAAWTGTQDEPRVSLHVKKLPLSRCLDSLASFGVRWFTNSDALNLSKAVTLNIENQPLHRLLKKIFAQAGDSLEYTLLTKNRIFVHLAMRFQPEPLITLQMKEAPLEKALHALVLQDSLISWAYIGDIDVTRPVTVDVSKMGLRKVLRILSRQQRGRTVFRQNDMYSILVFPSPKFTSTTAVIPKS